MSDLPVHQSPFEAALQEFEKQTGTNLIDHFLVKQFENCDSVESIVSLFLGQTNYIRKLRGDDSELMKSLKRVVSILYALSTATFGEGIGLLSLPVKAIFAAFAILLGTISYVIQSYDMLVELFGSITIFMRRVDIYTKIPPTPAMTEIVIKIMAELLSIIALATKQLMQGRLEKNVKKLLGWDDIMAILQRLDRLTPDEARMTAMQTLKVVHGLIQNLKVVMDDGHASMGVIWDALEFMQDITNEINGSQREKVQEHARDWLAPPDPSITHNNVRSLHHKGTSTWFVQGNCFAEWKSPSSNSLLWIRGKPGGGKSFLCSAIIEDIDHMRKRGLASLGFFYCDFRIDDKKSLRGMLSSLLVQLCYSSNSYSAILSDFYSEHDNGSRHPSDNALIGCLKRILKLHGKAPVYLIIDGLDAYPNSFGKPSPREDVLKFVEEVVSLHTANLHICITSRREADITKALGPLSFNQVSLDDESGQTQDIVNYIKFVVYTDRSMEKWSAADKELAIEVLTKHADGMFYWVFCQLGVLRHCLPTRIRQALDELPEGLVEMYERILQGINKSNWKIAHRLLQCLAIAFCPLRVEELAELLAFNFEAGSIPTFQADLRPDNPVDAVLSTCSSLISVVKVENSTFMNFSHISAKEFLMSTRLAQASDIISRFHVSMTAAHTIMARACLGILLHLDEKRITSDSLKDFPLTEYAAEHWVDHARINNVTKSMQNDLKRLFDPRRPHLTVLVWIYDPEIPRKIRSERPSRPTGTFLHYAALSGLPDLVKSLVTELSPDLNARSFSNDVTPLHLASRDGHVEVVLALLELGADVTTRDMDKSTPLHLASGRGHVNTAHVLLENHADAESQDVDGWTALHHAARGGHVGVTRVLLGCGADASAQDVDKSTPLHLASAHGHVDIARVLIEHVADVTAQDVDKSTPLHLASGRGHADIARVLLENHADAESQDVDGWTALHHASKEGHLEVARVLLQRGADVSAPNQDKLTPLHLASGCGYVNIARILLEHGADANARDVEGWTSLHQASGRGYVEVVRLLLEHSSNAGAQDLCKSTPSNLASGHGQTDIARALLEYDVEDESSWTPLHLASHEGHLEVVRLLLDREENPNAGNGNQQTPLSLASSKGRRKVVQFLLEKGADSNCHDRQKKTPLHVASEYGHIDIMYLLLDRGARIDAKDANLWTPLHMASKTGNHTITLELLNRGAKVDVLDDLLWTPLHLASQGGHQEVVRQLLDRRAHVGALEADRETALHLAAYYGRLEVTKLLLEHGADVRALNKNGKAPFELAEKEGHHQVASLLKSEAVAPQNISSRNQSVRRTSAAIAYPPPSGGAQGLGVAYPVQGSTQWGGSAHLDNGAYPGGFMQPGNITSPSAENRPGNTTHTSNLPSHTSEVSLTSVERDERLAFFIAHDKDSDGELSREELRALLDERGVQLSINTMTFIMTVFDTDGNRLINFDEFEPLWEYLTNWRKMFDSFDVNQDGRIDTTELGLALAHYNLHVSPIVLHKLMRKYEILSSWRPGLGGVPPPGQLDLDRFICACTVVKRMCALFQRWGTGGQSPISRDEFILAVIALP